MEKEIKEIKGEKSELFFLKINYFVKFKKRRES
jgi:hypothetical protein